MEQDESLERVGDSLRTLKHMSNRIGDELEEQSEMLDELGTAMASTDSRMGNVMRKLAKLSRLEDGNPFPSSSPFGANDGRNFRQQTVYSHSCVAGPDRIPAHRPYRAVTAREWKGYYSTGASLFK